MDRYALPGAPVPCLQGDASLPLPPCRNTDHSDVEGAIRRSLEALQLEYLDLYLIHWWVSCLAFCLG